MANPRNPTKRFHATVFSLGLTACCLIASTSAPDTWSAEVYKVVDENGKITFTDKPPKNKKADKVELNQTNTIPATAVTKRAAPPTPDDIPTDYQLQITYPPDQYHVNPGQRDLNIQVSADPSIHPSHQLQVTDNGAVIDGTVMQNIVVRGTHVIQARVVDPHGQIISQSEPIQIYVHRPTVRPPPDRR